MCLENLDYDLIKINRFRIDMDVNDKSSSWKISDLHDYTRYVYGKEAIIEINTHNEEVNRLLCEVVFKELNTNPLILRLLDEDDDDGDEGDSGGLVYDL